MVCALLLLWLLPPLLALALALPVLTAADAEASQDAVPYAIDDVTVTGGGSVHLKVLRNTATGESVEVMQNWGGKLERLVLRGGSGRPRDVIFSRCFGERLHCNATTLQHVRAAGGLLIPFANRVAHGRYLFSGREQRLSNDNSTVSHGLLVDGRPLQLVRQHSSSSNATLVLGVLFNGTDPGCEYDTPHHPLPCFVGVSVCGGSGWP
jgi:hypothetical protein